ncbi:hypothetical protein JYU14_03455 [Simkania negevensis]|uniref:Type II secretion system protein n=1 Tax=Simkania negevensis TaxID=83561 RepID=A0ABS3AQV7_9BACT|nr:hypothetical protein [Simkania negevensis]
MKRRRESIHFFTLLEMLVAFALFTTLSSMLFGSYFYLYRAKQNMERFEKNVYKHHYGRFRLQQVLQDACPPSPSPEKESEKELSLFFTLDKENNGGMAPPSLIFTYDNGVDDNPLFSSQVLGMIGTTPHGQLLLITWPSPFKWREQSPSPRIEVVFDKVEQFDMTFFYPPSHSKKDVAPKDVDKGREILIPPPGRLNRWKKEYGVLPVLMEIAISFQDGTTKQIPIAFTRGDNLVQYIEGKKTL